MSCRGRAPALVVGLSVGGRDHHPVVAPINPPRSPGRLAPVASGLPSSGSGLPSLSVELSTDRRGVGAATPLASSQLVNPSRPVARDQRGLSQSLSFWSPAGDDGGVSRSPTDARWHASLQAERRTDRLIVDIGPGGQLPGISRLAVWWRLDERAVRLACNG